MDHRFEGHYFKYITWNEDKEFHKRILSNNEIYFASGEKYDDPFECHIPIRYDNLTKEQWFNLAKKHLKIKNPEWNRDKLRHEAQSWMRKGDYKDPQYLNNFIENQIKYKYGFFGIFSLSLNYKNLLMWSLYADSHRGICIGFNIEKLKIFRERSWYESNHNINIDCLRVEYPEEFPFLDVTKMDEVESMKSQMAIKSQDWAHQEEIRLIIIESTNRKLIIDEDIISLVILGCQFPSDRKEEIIQILGKRTAKPKLYQAKILKESFGLDFEEIPY